MKPLGHALKIENDEKHLAVITPRLRLVALDQDLAQRQRDNTRDFFKALGAQYEVAWPPELQDGRFGEAEADMLNLRPDNRGWYGWIFLMALYPNAPLRAVGAGRFFGPPDARGTLEIEYAMLPSFREQGLATEAVTGMIDWAFAQEGVHKILARTLRHLYAPRRVLEKAGFEDYPPARFPDPDNPVIYYVRNKA